MRRFFAIFFAVTACAAYAARGALSVLSAGASPIGEIPAVCAVLTGLILAVSGRRNGFAYGCLCLAAVFASEIVTGFVPVPAALAAVLLFAAFARNRLPLLTSALLGITGLSCAGHYTCSLIRSLPYPETAALHTPALTTLFIAAAFLALLIEAAAVRKPERTDTAAPDGDPENTEDRGEDCGHAELSE